MVLRGQLLLQSSSVDGEDGGMIEGLQLRNYMDTAVVVCSSRGLPSTPCWTLRHCFLASSRRNARSSTAIKVMDGQLSLIGVSIDGAVHAASLEDASAQLIATGGCSFTNNKEAIATTGGGMISVKDSTFRGNSAAFLLDELVTGCAAHNTIDGSMFGRWERPAGFRCYRNVYVQPDTDVDEDEKDASFSCAVCGVDTWYEGNWLLLCDGDGCDRAYHTLCLAPPHLKEVPDGHWYCPLCEDAHGGLDQGQAELDEVDGFVIEAYAL